MPAYAVGADLDNIAALFGITRLTITPAVPKFLLALRTVNDGKLWRFLRPIIARRLPPERFHPIAVDPPCSLPSPVRPCGATDLAPCACPHYSLFCGQENGIMSKSMTLNVRVSGSLSDFVSANIGDTGSYENVSEYVRDLIRRDKERVESERLALLKAELTAAFSVPESEYLPLDANAIFARNVRN